MKKEFSEFYQPTEKEFEEMWDSCDFIFDTNILLNLYRYSLETRNTFITIMEQINDRIWIPYQVGFEYHKNRIVEIEKLKHTYDKVKESLTGFQHKIKDELFTSCNNGRHPYINYEDYLSKIETIINEISIDLDAKKEKHPDLLNKDPIRDKLTKLFNGRVCDQLDPEEKKEIITQGEDRYKKLIPPGYKDDGFGDLIIWFEMINHAKKSEKPIIFVTDDGKEDWWYQIHGKTIGPRPELIKEILEKANIKFYMYSADKFLNFAKEYLDSKVEPKEIEEARDIRLQEENLQIQRKNQEFYRTLLSAKDVYEMMERANQAAVPKSMIEMMERVNQAAVPQSIIDMMERANRTAIPQSMIDILENAKNYTIPQSVIDRMDSAKREFDNYVLSRQINPIRNITDNNVSNREDN
ncbi:DUF4935 domain-containing protein [Chloroflexota bacterium]|nr:DUF4935 domain-containing protein [Chloroflexota bacterium]